MVFVVAGSVPSVARPPLPSAVPPEGVVFDAGESVGCVMDGEDQEKNVRSGSPGEEEAEDGVEEEEGGR